MKTELVNVTPAMASEMLTHNTDNRPLRRTAVEGFKAALCRGEYIPTHQGIAFRLDGSLADGQHRLTAISELRDGCFPMLVTWGLPNEAFKVLDIGARRTAADALRENQRMVEVARLFAFFSCGNRGSISPTMLIPYLDYIRDIHDSLQAFCPTATKTWSSAPMRAAAVLLILKGVDSDYVKAIYRALVMADYGAMPPVCHALVKSVSAGSVRAGNTADMFARAVVALDPRNANLARIQISDPARATAAAKSFFDQALIATTHEDSKKKAPRAIRGAKSAIAANYLTSTI